MKRISTAWVIHGFALLHAAVAALCLGVGIKDGLLLTALTMLLTVIICLRRNLTTEFTAMSIILVIIVGYVLGNIGARLLDFCPPMLQHALSTFIVTELLGWTLDGFASRFLNSGAAAHERRVSWKKDYGWLVFAVLVVFGIRALFVYVFSSGTFQGSDLVQYTFAFLDNGASIVLMIAASILFIRFSRRHIHSERVSLPVTFLFLIVVSVACSVIVTMDLPFHLHKPDSPQEYYRNTLVALVVETTVFSLAYMVNFAVNMQKEVVWQRKQRHQAEFRYFTLKSHVNPHFLFNSLNVLDNIIKESSREEASQYVHKLSGIYRYLLRHEQNRLVPLSEEVIFAKMYLDLLKIRFPEGIKTVNHIADEDLSRMMVPCTLQILLENACKHNAISKEDPLVIELSSDGKSLTVSNRIIPRVTPSASTGLGLQYIRNQYRDLAGKEVVIEKTTERFTVILPLLED